MNIQNTYDSAIRPEIETLDAEIQKAISGNALIEEYHKGWRVFFSPVIHRPKVLLIGINPGAGQAGVKDFDFWDETFLFEYVNPEENNYALARETIDAFSQASLVDVLETSTVKTNFYFLSTTKESELYEITSHLGRALDGNQEMLGDKVFRKSAEWTKRLIDLIEPGVIVCEGKGAYEKVTELFPEYGESDWTNDCGYTIVPASNLVIIGYGRMSSRIRNKPELANLLKRFIKP